MRLVIALCLITTLAGEYADADDAERLPATNALLSILENHTAYDLDTAELDRAMVQGLINALNDPYAAIIDTSGADRSGTTALAEGVDAGLTLTTDSYGCLVVHAVAPGSAAAGAGIEPADRLLRVGAGNTAGQSAWEVLPQLLIQPDETLRVVTQRPGEEPRHLELKWTPYETDTISVRVGDVRRRRWRDSQNGEIAWCSIRTFDGDTTPAEWNRMVETILAAPNVRFLIIDLRGNGGGDNACIPLLGDFFMGGETLVNFRRELSEREWTQTVVNSGRPRSRLIPFPSVAIVNHGTASLGEITAAALRDNRGVPIVGTQTFGKGTTQTWVDLDGSYAAHLTVGSWTSPAGTSIENAGLQPDVVIADNPRTPNVDEQLLRAVDVLYSLTR